MQKTDNTSRTGILIKNTVRYKRRKDLETKGTSVVWIQVAHKGKKDILIQSIYRQFQRLNHPTSGTITHQFNRWKSIVDKWKTASLENRELITVGDLNINYLSWDLHPTQQTSQEKSQSKMMQYFKDNITTQGHTIVNTKPTRNVGSLTERQTCLDYILTNRIDMMNNYKNIYPTFSDHSLLIYCRKIKSEKNTRQFVRSRKITNFDIEKYRNDIFQHSLYLSSLYDGNVDSSAESLVKLIQESLDLQSPVKKYLITPKNRPRISAEAREILAMRDTAHLEYKKSGHPDDLRHMKNLRNLANKKISTENHINIVKKFQKEGDSTTTLPPKKWQRL